MQSEMSGTVLTLTQALQLAGLAPCIFLVIFLTLLSFRNREAAIPAAFFFALGASLMRPLLALYPETAGTLPLDAMLMFGQSALAALVFLLVMQFSMGRVPSAPYFLVLLVPLLGGGLLSYASATQAESCTAATRCLDIAAIEVLYNVISSGFVFLLLVFFSSRAGLSLVENGAARAHRYWLMIALILLNLLVLSIDLARLAHHFTPQEAAFAVTVLRLTFIYLVITSLFRVLYPGMAREVVSMGSDSPRYDPEQDRAPIERIRALLEVERVYAEMRLNRAALAEKVGVSEHHLSRIINGAFGKSFNELINSYRIDEAKRRLKSEPSTPITTIGFEVGFNSIASFNRVFKEKVGVSPTEYKNISSQ